jgi:hypothetical protein
MLLLEHMPTHTYLHILPLETTLRGVVRRFFQLNQLEIALTVLRETVFEQLRKTLFQRQAIGAITAPHPARVTAHRTLRAATVRVATGGRLLTADSALQTADSAELNAHRSTAGFLAYAAGSEAYNTTQQAH